MILINTEYSKGKKIELRCDKDINTWKIKLEENIMIEGKKIYLRAMEYTDMECFKDMLNDPDISSNVVGWSFPVSDVEQNNWFEQAVKDQKNKRFTIVMKESNKAVGMVTLTNIDWHNRSATHGIKLHPSCPKRQGIATDAVMTLMQYAFEEVNLNRLNGSWITYNLASKKLYEKCGWYVEGIKKQAIYRNGEYHDLAISGILKSEYIAVKEKLD